MGLLKFLGSLLFGSGPKEPKFQFINQPFVLRIFHHKCDQVSYTVDEDSLKVTEVKCNIGLIPGDTVIGCMAYDVRGKKFSDCQKYMSEKKANVVALTVLRVGDKFDNMVAQESKLPTPNQYHIYTCGQTVMPGTEEQAMLLLDDLYKTPCHHQTASAFGDPRASSSKVNCLYKNTIW